MDEERIGTSAEPEEDAQAELGFTIQDDSSAEWALERIKEAMQERDRLLELVEAKQAKLDEQKEQIQKRYERDTEYLTGLLSGYMQTVKVKSTKTQDTYQLLTGKLIRKRPTLSFDVDKPALLAWLEGNNRNDLIKVEKAPKWAEVKKLITGDPVTGVCILDATGEVLDGVTATETPEKFDIKFAD